MKSSPAEEGAVENDGTTIMDSVSNAVMDAAGKTKGRNTPLLTRIEEGIGPYGLWPVPDGYDPAVWDIGRVSVVSVDVDGHALDAYAIRCEGSITGNGALNGTYAYFPGTSPITRIAGKTGGAMTVKPVDLEALGASPETLRVIRENGDEPRDMLAAYIVDNDGSVNRVDMVLFLSLPVFLPLLRRSKGRRGKARSGIEAQDANKPREYKQALSKVTNMGALNPGIYVGDMLGELSEGEYGAIAVGRRGGAPHAYMSITSAPDVGHLEPFDIIVMCAISTLQISGNKNLTPRQIYRVFTGSDEKPAATILNEVDKSVRRLMGNLIRLDCTDEIQGRKLVMDGVPEGIAGGGVELNALMAARVDVETKRGDVVTGYKLLTDELPVLFAHDLCTKQVTSIPRDKLAAIIDAQPKTKKNILLAHHIMQRVARMENGATRSSYRIRFDNLMEGMGWDSANSKERGRAVKKVKAYLDAMAACGHISLYETYRERGARTDTGVVIVPNGKTLEECKAVRGKGKAKKLPGGNVKR